jgi:hypothetical protein
VKRTVAAPRLPVRIFVVAGAVLAGTAWLLLRAGPAEVARPGDAPGVRVERAGKQGPAGTPPPPVAPEGRGPEARVHLAVRGMVLASDGTPAEGALVVVSIPAATEGTAAPAVPAVPAPPDVPVGTEVLREMFALTDEEAAGCCWATGIPRVPPSPLQAPEAGRARTGTGGAFEIRVDTRGPFRVDASHEGGTATESRVRAGGAPCLLRLAKRAALEGRVLQDMSNAPVEGAVVVAASRDTSATATSGPDGAFALPGLAPGRWRVTAGAAGYAMAVQADVEVPTKEPLDLRLGTGWTANVKVWEWSLGAPGRRRRDAPRDDTRRPLEGALVALLQRSTGSFRAGVSGPDGTVRLDRLGPGTWEIAARKEGYGVGIGRALRLAPDGPPEESRDVRLVPLAPTTVVVRGEDGAPLAGVAVYTGGEGEDFDPRRSRLLGRTDVDGRIAVTFDEGVPWKAVAWVIPDAGAAAVKVEPGEPGEAVKVALGKGRVVEGVVKDSRGRLLAGARVTLTVDKDPREMGLEFRTRTDDTGAFRFPAVPFGGISIDVETADGDIGDLAVDDENREDPLVREIVAESFAEDF